MYINFNFFVVKFCDFDTYFANDVLFKLIFRFNNNLNCCLIVNKNV